jgi:hypothetical protein
MTSRADFYVYILFRESGAPFYVGMGRRDRCLVHERNVRNNIQDWDNPHKTNIIRKMLAFGRDVPVVKISARLTHEKACEYERAWIATLGRDPSGPLVNRTDGGDGAPGVIVSEVTRRKISAILKGKKHSEAHRQKLREANLEQIRALQSANAVARRGKPMSEAQRQKLIGHSVSEAARQKLREANLGKKASEATRAKMSATHLSRASNG